MKQTISIIVIIAALAGAGVFAYLAMTGSDSNSTGQLVTEGASSQILPMGSSLKFDSVQKYNRDSRLFPYPVVNPSEIGTTTGELMQ